MRLFCFFLFTLFLLLSSKIIFSPLFRILLFRFITCHFSFICQFSPSINSVIRLGFSIYISPILFFFSLPLFPGFSSSTFLPSTFHFLSFLFFYYYFFLVFLRLQRFSFRPIHFFVIKIFSYWSFYLNPKAKMQLKTLTLIYGSLFLEG